MNDPYASGWIPMILSWVVAVPAFLAFVQIIAKLFTRIEDVPLALSIWIGICFLILSPLLYIACQYVAGVCYPFQSVAAFLSTFFLVLFVPIIFMIMFMIGFALPYLGVTALAGIKRRRLGLTLASVLAPIAALLGNLLFGLALPFAALSTHSARADDLIRATNGPGKLPFYVVQRGMIALPPYYRMSTGTVTDTVRMHVAWIYLSKDERAEFLRAAYPEIAAAVDPADY